MDKTKKKKILIIDDQECFAYLLKNSLESTGKLEVLWEPNAYRGIQAVYSNPDLRAICVDIHMPCVVQGWGLGYDLLEDLYKTGAYSHVPKFVISAVTKPTEKNADLRRWGVVSWLNKPLDMPMFSVMLCNYLEKYSTGFQPNIGGSFIQEIDECKDEAI